MKRNVQVPAPSPISPRPLPDCLRGLDLAPPRNGDFAGDPESYGPYSPRDESRDSKRKKRERRRQNDEIRC